MISDLACFCACVFLGDADQRIGDDLFLFFLGAGKTTDAGSFKLQESLTDSPAFI
ncbi:uncharacterized protein METZ01_LOCUS300401, partial [marine metagenome]